MEPEELRKMVNRLAMKGAGMTETVKPKSGQNRNKEKQNGYEVSQKLMLTWLTSYPEIFGEVSRYIGPDDFTRPSIIRLPNCCMNSTGRGTEPGKTSEPVYGQRRTDRGGSCI